MGKPLKLTFIKIYRKLFSIQEIDNSLPLQWIAGISLFVFFITFNSWSFTQTVTVENAERGYHLCWPYFKNCGDWYFLSSLPFGYSQNIFYMFIFIIMFLTAFAIWKRKWTYVHMGLLILFLWEYVFLFVLNMGKRGNYDYYQVILTAIFLFIPFKFNFLRITYCALYTLASTIKIHAGWVLGTYFTTLKLGMPIFPDELTPLFTNGVIFMEMLGCWFLLSKNKFLQRASLLYFIIFHLYSGIIVWYRYPATILPFLLVLFGPIYSDRKVPLTLKAIPGWMLIGALCLLQSISFIIPKDSKMTFEGLNYGFYMFDSNHQCISAREIHYKSGEVKRETKEMESARSRCDPYYRWFKIWWLCHKSDGGIDRIKWRFIHSVNGGPFYKIVDVENACKLEYKVFQHNEWIQTPEDGAEILGYPVKNIYY